MYAFGDGTSLTSVHIFHKFTINYQDKSTAWYISDSVPFSALTCWKSRLAPSGCRTIILKVSITADGNKVSNE